MKKIAIFGATGTIGKQTIELLKDRDDYELVSVSGYKNTKVINDIVNEFPTIKSVYISEKLNINKKIKIYNDNILDLFCDKFDYVVNAVSGFAGLKITLEAIKKNKIIFLANKESLVCGENLIYELLEKYPKSKIYPIDSEHSSLFQLLENNESNISKLYITASGGPFLNKSIQETKIVKKDEVLKHPTWNMGKEITINSATMFNKALEIIEAKALFKTKNISVLVQPQSLIHSLIKYEDNTYKMIMSYPDMKQSINYFLNENQFCNFPNQKDIDFSKGLSISFEEINQDRFLPIKLAYECLNSFNSKSIALNSANEVCVELFLSDKISFYEITKYVVEVFYNIENVDLKTYDEIEKFHFMVRNKTLNLINNK